MNRDEARRIVAVLRAAPFARRRDEEFTEITLEMWLASLVKLDYGRTERTIAAMLDETMFMPTPAEVRARYDDMLRREARENQQPALPESAQGRRPSREQQLANVRRLKGLLRNVGRRVE